MCSSSEELAKEINREIPKNFGIIERPMRRKNKINKIYGENSDRKEK